MSDQPTGIGEDDLWTDSDCSPGVYYCELVTCSNGNLSLGKGGFENSCSFTSLPGPPVATTLGGAVQTLSPINIVLTLRSGRWPPGSVNDSSHSYLKESIGSALA